VKSSLNRWIFVSTAGELREGTGPELPLARGAAAPHRPTINPALLLWPRTPPLPATLVVGLLRSEIWPTLARNTRKFATAACTHPKALAAFPQPYLPSVS
jgi:hypothetical protein